MKMTKLSEINVHTYNLRHYKTQQLSNRTKRRYAPFLRRLSDNNHRRIILTQCKEKKERTEEKKKN